MTAEEKRQMVVDLATKVMGWRKVQSGEWTITQGGLFFYDHAVDVAYYTDGKGGSHGWSPLDNIADAWMVVEALMLKRWFFELSSSLPPSRDGNTSTATFSWPCHCGGGCNDKDASAPTAPEAICRAALKAVSA